MTVNFDTDGTSTTTCLVDSLDTEGSTTKERVAQSASKTWSTAMLTTFIIKSRRVLRPVSKTQRPKHRRIHWPSLCVSACLLYNTDIAGVASVAGSSVSLSIDRSGSVEEARVSVGHETTSSIVQLFRGKAKAIFLPLSGNIRSRRHILVVKETS